MVEGHPFRSQSFLGLRGQRAGHCPSDLVSMFAANGFSFEEVETCRLSHRGSPHDELSSPDIPRDPFMPASAVDLNQLRHSIERETHRG